MSHIAHDHHRRSIRLRGHDYASYGAYFVTLCIHGRLNLLGDVIDGAMRLSPVGEMARDVWENVTHLYEGVAGDAYLVMPNHIHAIVLLSGRDEGQERIPGQVENRGQGQDHGQGQSPAPTGTPSDGAALGALRGDASEVQRLRPVTIGDVVARYKTYTTHEYGQCVRLRGWPPYEGRLWQRNYYEHIIRNDRELDAIRAYIQNNPAQWAVDRENPARL